MTLPIYPLAVRGLTWPLMKTFEFATDNEAAPNMYEVAILNSQNPIWHYTLIYDYLKDDPQDLVSSLSPHTDYRYLEGFLLALQGAFAAFLLDDLTDDCFGMQSIPGGGVSSFPSAFKPTLYPTQEFYYPLSSLIVDTEGTPQVYQVTTPGFSGSTYPSFGGSTVSSGSVVLTKVGAFIGGFGAPLPLVTDGAGNYYSPIQRTFGGQFAEDVTDLNTLHYPLTVWDNGVQKTVSTHYTVAGPGLTVAGNAYTGMYIAWGGSSMYVPTGPVTALGQFYFRLRAESDAQDIEYFLRNLWTIGGTSAKNGSGMLKLRTRRPNFQ